MRPVVAPAGTTAVIRVSESTENWVAATLLKVTALAPVKWDPDTSTTVPTSPLSGLKPVIVGAGGVWAASTTSTNDATEGTPDEERRKSMYGPGGASVPSAGPVTRRVFPPLTLKERST